ncbi:MAG: LysR family transcriptional regulator [Sphingomonas fennica]
MQHTEHGSAAGPRYRWDDLRLFMIAAETGSLRSAAAAAGCAVNTIRSRIEQLEHDLGLVLAKRTIDGLTLTAEGREMLSIAREMSSGASALDRLRQSRGTRAASRVSIQVTEGLGTFWLMPRIVDFQAEHPHLTVDLRCDMRPVDVLFRDVDIAVQLDRPVHPDLIVTKIGTLHIMPFAAPGYLAAHGTPGSIEELLRHKLVLQTSDQVPTDAETLLLGSDLPPGTVAIRANTSSAHYWAIARGAGIGVLPTYARAMTRRVVPVDAELKLRRDILLVYHPDARRSKATELAIDWIRRSFDPDLYPWFSDTFIHPTELEGRLRGDSANIVNLFADMEDIDFPPHGPVQ